MFLKSDSAQARRRAVLCVAAIGSAAVWAAAAAVQAGDPPLTNTDPAQTASGQPAADHSAASAKPEKPKTDPGDKVVCKYDEEETGTRLGSNKVCHTKREWEQISRDSADYLNKSTNPR